MLKILQIINEYKLGNGERKLFILEMKHKKFMEIKTFGCIINDCELNEAIANFCMFETMQCLIENSIFE